MSAGFGRSCKPWSMSMTLSDHRWGGKATALYELQRAGFRVPEFEVVVAASEHIPEIVGRLGLPLAVRSSATIEDGLECSFAGQYESYLNLRSLAAVEVAVKKCLESLRTPGSVAYCRTRGLDPSTVQMAATAATGASKAKP